MTNQPVTQPRQPINWLALWCKFDSTFFPVIPDPQRHLSWWQYLLFAGVGLVIFSFIASFLPANGFVAYDWVNYFSKGERGYGLEYYPPWMVWVQYLTWPGLLGITFTGLALALYQRYASPLIMVLAFLTFPFIWVIFLGQIEGVIVFGLTGMPWLVPLVTIKPQVGYLAFLARKEHLAVLIGWMALSLVIWGFWPLDMLKIGHYVAWQEPHDISWFPWSVPLALVLMWFSRGDADMLMVAGTFALPYVHSYHYFVILPAMARLKWWVALLALIISWLPLLANWFGPWCWQLGHLFPILLWVSLYLKRRRLLSTNQEQPLAPVG